MSEMATTIKKWKIRTVVALTAAGFLLSHAGIVAANGAKVIIGP